MNGVIINGALHSYKSAACQIHSCLWCHNETVKGGTPRFQVRYFGRKDGPVGEGGKSAQAAWRSAYEALSVEATHV